jgi:hypothetical protein
MMTRVKSLKVKSVAPLLGKPGMYVVRLEHPYFKSKNYSALADRAWEFAALIREAIEKR